MQKMKILELFAGIGGFSLSGRNVGWTTKAWVEINPFCQKVLNKNFPNAVGFDNVKTFSYAIYKSILRNKGVRDRAINVITGGFPCQPFSHAGKREGEKDERFLWAEFDRIVGEVKPMVVVAENVSGLLTIQDGLVFERVCTDLENRGYEVQAFVIPACAVGAPHRRDRVWIVAYSESARRQREARNIFETQRRQNGKLLSESVNTNIYPIDNPHSIQCRAQQRSMAETDSLPCEHRTQIRTSGQSCGTIGNDEESTNTKCEGLEGRTASRETRVFTRHQRHIESTANAHSIGHQEPRTQQPTNRHGQFDEVTTDPLSNERQFLCGQKPEPTHKGHSDDFVREQSFADTVVGDTESPGFESGTDGQRQIEHGRTSAWHPQFKRNWYEVAAELCRVDDGISPQLDKLRNADRVPRLTALGNAIVPAVAEQVFRAIIESYNTPSV